MPDEGEGAWTAAMSHGVGVASRADIYTGWITERGVDKFVRKG
jgi:hypothetical protein